MPTASSSCNGRCRGWGDAGPAIARCAARCAGAPGAALEGSGSTHSPAIAHLERDPREWRTLDALANITISRFCRDRGVFAFLQSDGLPSLLERTDHPLLVWSAGCAGGEEAYTLAIAWEFAIAPNASGAELKILATDVERAMLRRAAAARYPPSALRELPADWRESAFTRDGAEFMLRPFFRRCVTVIRHNVRTEPPPGRFDLVLCRNVAFTYFDDAGQRDTLKRTVRATAPGAAFVIGAHERLPAGERGFEPWAPEHGVFRRIP